jgi:hypothetical protein
MVSVDESHLYEDYHTALSVLQQYKERDGLDVSSLMNSKVHGGLTYNDFLLLPGKICMLCPETFSSMFTSDTD